MAAKKTNNVSDESLKDIVEVPEDQLTPEGLDKDSDEAKELARQRDFLGQIAKTSFSQAADARRKYDQEWIARNLFWRGYQFSRYLPQTQTVVLSSRQSARIPVNYIASNMRSIRNQVTSFRPKFEVLPTNPQSEQSKTQARYSQRILDYYFDRLKMKRKIKETITQALMYSIGGPWQIVYDEDKKEVRVWMLDPFDWYCDPLAEEYDEAEFMIKAVRTPVNAVTTNQRYNPYARVEITGGDNKIAASQYKQFMIQALKQVSPRTNEGSAMTIIYEGDFKRRRETGEVYMVKCIWAEQNTIPLLYEESDTDEFDYVVYRGDLNPKDIYGESWMKHVMPLNRALNSLETSAFEYNYRVAKGRIVVDRDSGVRAIHNVHGEIISKNRGAEVKALDMAPLPVAVPQQIERMWRYIEDLSGVHEACVDKETEILTADGWTKGKDLLIGTKIITFNLESGVLELDEVKNKFTYQKENEKLVHIKNKNMDALVTRNHRWPVYSDTSNKKFGKKDFKETQELKTTDHLILSANYHFPTEKVYSDAFVELVGWYVTEGSNHTSGLRIIQSRKNNNECALIEDCLKRLDCYRVPYATFDGMFQYYVQKDVADSVKVVSPDKELTFDFIGRLTEQQANLLYKTLLLGDGTEISAKTLFWSTNKNNVDSFQYLATLLGFNTRVSLFKRSNLKKYAIIRGSGVQKPLYVVSIKDQTRFTGFSSNVRKEGFVIEEYYTGEVWCPETNNGTFVARRNGFVFITGNSLGRIPTGVKTGIGIAELKQADATSQDDLIDNLEDFLNEVGMKLLKKIAQNYSGYKVIRDLGIREGNEAAFVAIGKKFQKKKAKLGLAKNGKVKIGPDFLDIAQIGEDNNIRVTVGSWLGYTKEALQQKVYSMFQMQLIDQATALRLLEFGTIDEIVQQTRIEAVLKKNIGQPQDPNQPDQLSLAMTENDMMLHEGKEMPVSENDDHFVHIAVHQDALGRGFDDIVLAHIQKHQFYAGNSIGQSSGGIDTGDQARAQAVAAQQQPTPQGPPPGTQLPQQNMPQATMQNQAQAGQMMGQGAPGQ